MNTPMPSYYVRQEAKRRRAAEKLIKEHGGDYTAAADDAWQRMESETDGTKANFWGAVVLDVQTLETEAKTPAPLPVCGAYLWSGKNIFTRCPTCGRSQMHSHKKIGSQDGTKLGDVFVCAEGGHHYTVRA